jgi:uncharacterized protein YdhG (YjbR/CyaY superfamily)
MEQAVIDYIANVPAEFRPLFDRIQRLIVEACPDADVVLSYNMPTYKVGKRRLQVAVWQHGVSVYGWKNRGDGGFTARHPDLRTSTGTIRLRPADAADIADDEILELARQVLSG